MKIQQRHDEFSILFLGIRTQIFVNFFNIHNFCNFFCESSPTKLISHLENPLD